MTYNHEIYFPVIYAWDQVTPVEAFPPVLESEEIIAGKTLDELERIAIRKSLEKCRGNRTHAARALGISIRTLQRKIQEYGLPICRPVVNY